MWYTTFKRVLPVYIAVHLAFLILTYLATLFTLPNFSPQSLRLYTLLHSWYRWDSGHFVLIATQGYTPWWETAFFPLYPLLEWAGSLLTRDPFIAGLIVSNVIGLVMLAVLYRLVEEDFDQECASRTVLYLSVFPTAFFFAAGYNESLFLCLVLLSFYYMRQGHWWLAGLFGFLASLTRSAGLLLLVPFCYEYLRQHYFKLEKMRFDAFSVLLIPAGIGIFAGYCYLQFHDPFAFAHAQGVWRRSLHFPWHGAKEAFTYITTHSVLSFNSIHNMIDLSAVLLAFILIVFCFWKFPRHLWAYSIYAATTYLFFLLVPSKGDHPLESFSRLMLEIFPAFIILAIFGKKQQFQLYYLVLSVPVLSFMLLQFLTGHWIV